MKKEKKQFYKAGSNTRDQVKKTGSKNRILKDKLQKGRITTIVRNFGQKLFAVNKLNYLNSFSLAARTKQTKSMVKTLAVQFCHP